MQFLKKKGSDTRNVLVASAGAKLFSFEVTSGHRLSVWPQDGADSSDANSAETNAETHGPPGKKRKVDSSSEQQSGHKNGRAAANNTPSWTYIPILASTADGEYLAALTGEDKCIRVFQLGEDGAFRQLSER